VLGAFYFGSLGRGAAGRFSDLDIFVWVADDVVLPAHDKVRQWLELFGTVHWQEIEGTTGYVGPEWTQVDIEYDHLANLQPSYRYAGAKVIKDTGDTLAQYVATCTPEQFVETVESATAIIHDAIGEQFYRARTNARGSVWSALGDIADYCTRTYELLGRLRGRRTYGLRHVEELLTREEQALLLAAWPREPTREENRRASQALWIWTKYVWQEAERVIGQPLNIERDEQAMLGAIERIYT
jgi:hypothetical protein